MKNFFITGISGFLGRNLVLRLKEMGDVHLFGLVLSGDPAFEYYKDDPDITLVEGNILDKESVSRFLSLAGENSYLIHAAARIGLYGKNDPITSKINYEGTQIVVDEALKHSFERVLYVSTVDVLSEVKDGVVYAPDQFFPEKAFGVYGESKALASQYVLDVCKEKGLPGIIVCPSAVLGPNDPFMSPMNDALKRFCLGKIPAITPGGYDVVDMRDVADGILLALEKGRIGETYILPGHRVSVKELFEEFARASNRKTPKIKVPFFLLSLVAPLSEWIARKKKKRPMLSPLAIKCLKWNPHYDLSKAQEELGYAPRELKKTTEDTVAWLKEAGHIS